jgi:hypothetical protein
LGLQILVYPNMEPLPFKSFWSASVIIASLGIVSCAEQKTKTDSDEAPPAPAPTVAYNPYEKSEITVEVFKVDSLENSGSTGWGYDILINGQLYIHQPNIPAVMGNNGFSSEEKAREAGELIISKIRNNVLPPSVTVEELETKGLLE